MGTFVLTIGSYAVQVSNSRLYVNETFWNFISWSFTNEVIFNITVETAPIVIQHITIITLFIDMYAIATKLRAHFIIVQHETRITKTSLVGGIINEMLIGVTHQACWEILIEFLSTYAAKYCCTSIRHIPSDFTSTITCWLIC